MANHAVFRKPTGSEKQSLTDSFQQYFFAELASTPEQQRDSYRVRYRVYCEEFEYESAENCAGRLEVDEFDEHSYHCIIRHRSTERAAGCVRLVALDKDRLMPIEKYCLDSISPEYKRILEDDRQKVCEISRLAVDGAFRRRLGETCTRWGKPAAIDVSRREQRTFSLIAVAAFLGAAALSDITGRTRTFAMMEPFLPRLLQRSGIKAYAAGSEVDYHGIRAAYFMSTEEAVAGMKPELRQLYSAVHENLLRSYRALGKD
jgi:N-acyl amino acid synthase of PEP-CTERM/exosortase system